MPIRCLEFKSLMTASVGEHSQQLALLYVAGGSVKWKNHSGKLFSSYIFLYTYHTTKEFHSLVFSKDK